jgi:hypothetical protein
MNLKILAGGAVAALSLAAAGAASAATITLNFDALNGGANEEPLNYYAGGFGSDGTGPGPNYGITFSSNTITGCVAGNPCANTNSALAPSNPNVIFFLSGGADTMDVAGGFTTGFSFFYSSVNVPGVVNVWSGLDGTGTLLATLNLPVTPANGAPGCLGEPFCPYFEFGVNFAGTAMSVDFGGTANQIAFDNITLGSPIAPLPEPAAWALMLVGFGGLGVALRSRRHASATVA